MCVRGDTRKLLEAPRAMKEISRERVTTPERSGPHTRVYVARLRMLNSLANRLREPHAGPEVTLIIQEHDAPAFQGLLECPDAPA
jgi:hypothetical protein